MKQRARSIELIPESIANLLKTIAVLFVLYVFLVSIGLIGTAFKGIGSTFAENLMQSSTGPLVGLFVGILATSTIQSSSTTTSLLVGMVAAGMFGSDPRLAVAAAVPYIMGANIGTSVTNTLVSLGHILNRSEFRRAFSASIIHDFFNVFSVLLLFPLQYFFNIIGASAYALATSLLGTGSISFKSPVKVATEPAVDMMVGLVERQGLVDVNWVLIILALFLLFLSLRYLTKLIRSLVMLRLEAFFDTHIFKTWIRAMGFGVFITVLVQSSSITTSLAVPLAGAGILTLRQIFPYTLGTNIGTTITAILASLVSGTLAPLAVAISHLIFNIFGILLIWPIERVREIPVKLSLWFAELAYRNRIIPFLYILIGFFLIPLLFIALLS